MALALALGVAGPAFADKDGGSGGPSGAGGGLWVMESDGHETVQGGGMTPKAVTVVAALTRPMLPQIAWGHMTLLPSGG